MRCHYIILSVGPLETMYETVALCHGRFLHRDTKPGASPHETVKFMRAAQIFVGNDSTDPFNNIEVRLNAEVNNTRTIFYNVSVEVPGYYYDVYNETTNETESVYQNTTWVNVLENTTVTYNATDLAWADIVNGTGLDAQGILGQYLFVYQNDDDSVCCSSRVGRFTGFSRLRDLPQKRQKSGQQPVKKLLCREHLENV